MIYRKIKTIYCVIKDIMYIINMKTVIDSIIQLFSYKITWFFTGILAGFILFSVKGHYDDMKYQLAQKMKVDSLQERIVYSEQKNKIILAQKAESDSVVKTLQETRQDVKTRYIKIHETKIPEITNPDSAYIWLLNDFIK